MVALAYKAGPVEVTAAGELRLAWHPGQERAWQSPARVVAVIAGSQAGKTVFGPAWLRREVELRGPGDYLVAAPSYPLLNLKAMPEFLRLFKTVLRLGEYKASPVRCFTFSPAGAQRTFGHLPQEPTRVYFGHANDPDSLEAMTAKAAWLDEAGQWRFRQGSWEAVQRRLAVHRGRALITTTPYNLGWLKQKVYDPWLAGDPDVEVVRFESIMNPAFSREEFERQRLALPRWRFDMMFRGVFSRPAGLIYDVFQFGRHTCAPFDLPPEWPRVVGLDFGGVHTGAVVIARQPNTGKLFLYSDYLFGGLTAAQHVHKLRRFLRAHGGGYTGVTAVGGAGSEQNWRDEFTAAGLPVLEPPVRDVEVGINRVYAALQADELTIFDGCQGLLDEIQSYSRKLDEGGEPTEQIEHKENYHRLDALRYAMTYIRRPQATGIPALGLPGAGQQSVLGHAARDWKNTRL
jgi:hypothetical protein